MASAARTTGNSEARFDPRLYRKHARVKFSRRKMARRRDRRCRLQRPGLGCGQFLTRLGVASNAPPELQAADWNKRHAGKPPPLSPWGGVIAPDRRSTHAAAAGRPELDLPRDGARVGSLQGGQSDGDLLELSRRESKIRQLSMFLRNYLALRACFPSRLKNLQSGILISYHAIEIAPQACACVHKTKRISSQSVSPTGKRCEYTLHKREI